MVRIKYFLLTIFFVPSIVFSQLPKTGLFFYAHESNIDKRTSLVLNDQQPYKLNQNDVFSLKFDLFLRNEKIKFGYVFRIILNNDENIDLVINNEQDRFLIVSKHVNSESHSQTCRFNDLDPGKIQIINQWNDVGLTLDKKNNRIRFRFNGNEAECRHDLSQTNSLLVNFGICDYNEGFAIHDVSPVLLKDIVVSRNEKTIHHWTLNKHAGKVVYDEISKTPARVNNPYWMEDNSVYWRKSATFNVKNYPEIAFDSIANNVYIFNDDKYITYSVQSNQSKEMVINHPVSLSKYNNQLIYDGLNRKIIAYNIDPPFINFFDFSTNAWDYQSENIMESSHSHHNRYLSYRDSSLYLFGGYGFYKYKSDLFRVGLDSGEWIKNDLSQQITPRYLSSMGGSAAGDKLYVLGGRGAEMGLQELAPKNFLDLYEVDLATLNVKQLYDFSNEPVNKDFVYSSNLIVDDKDSCFYALAYPNNKYSSYLVLKKMSLKKPLEETFGDTIEYYFQDKSSYCDLYYSPSLSKLIAIASYSNNNENFQVSIYTLNYPPLSEQDVLQDISRPDKSFMPLLIIISVASLFITGIIVMLRKRSGRKNPIQQQAKPLEVLSEESGPVSHFYPRNISSILFLGGFQVFSKKGDNLTSEFTPTLKYMLVLIVLYTLKDKKGISSHKLHDLLWFDKSEESARNNRNVNMRKLRVLLAEIGDMDISNKDAYWKLVSGKDIFSDFTEASELIDRIKASSGDNIGDIWRLLDLLSYGTLLPNIQLEWIDVFKNDFSNAVIDILLGLLNDKDHVCSRNLSLRLKMADVVLIYDSISEEAMRVKCNTLFKLGKKGLAKTAFDNFAKEYKTLLNETYPGSLSGLLKDN